jgi:hypothetical protein
MKSTLKVVSEVRKGDISEFALVLYHLADIASSCSAGRDKSGPNWMKLNKLLCKSIKAVTSTKKRKKRK